MPLQKLLKVTYNDFKNLEVIDPDKFDQNNQEIVDHIDSFVDAYNALEIINADTNAKAIEALDTANEANTKADNAVSTANTAEAKADLAIDTADSAVVIATEANAKADMAIATASDAVASAEQAAIEAELASIAARSAVGNTVRKIEVYTIVNPNNGDGTFTYKDVNDIEYIGEYTVDNEQVFELIQGNYPLGENRIEVLIDDTLHRTVASGGLREVDETHIALTVPEDVGREITIIYFEKIGMAGEHKLSHGVGQYDEVAGIIYQGTVKPNSSTAFWYKEVV